MPTNWRSFLMSSLTSQNLVTRAIVHPSPEDNDKPQGYDLSTTTTSQFPFIVFSHKWSSMLCHVSCSFPPDLGYMRKGVDYNVSKDKCTISVTT